MRNPIVCKVTGGDELKRKLEELGPKAMMKAVRKALSQAALLMSQRIADAAPEDSGFLHSHISFKVRSAKGITTVKIGPTQDRYPNRAGSKKKRRA